jgi:TnpA family transposase
MQRQVLNLGELNTTQTEQWQRSIEVIEAEGQSRQRRLFTDREGGVWFAPRLRDLADRRLYVADGHADHGALDSMIGGVINLCKIEEMDETLRMTASIRAGTVAPSALPIATP